MNETNRNFPTYYNGYMGTGESFQKLAEALAASTNRASEHATPSAARPTSELTTDFPLHYNGYTGNGGSMRSMTRNLQ